MMFYGTEKRSNRQLVDGQTSGWFDWSLVIGAGGQISEVLRSTIINGADIFLVSPINE